MDFSSAEEEVAVTSISSLLIYQPEQRFTFEVAAQVLRKQFVVPLPESLVHSCGMRRDQQMFEFPQRRICRQRLFVEHIKRGSGNLPLAKGFDQRSFIDQRTAAYVDQKC